MESLSLPQQVARGDLNRLRGYGENLDFYSGRQWQGRARRGERRLTFNYVRVLLEKTTSYLSANTSFAMESLEPDIEGRRRVREVEVEGSFAQAKEVVQRIRDRLEASIARERVPAGSPPLGGVDFLSLSSREKIFHALSQE